MNIDLTWDLLDPKTEWNIEVYEDTSSPVDTSSTNRIATLPPGTTTYAITKNNPGTFYYVVQTYDVNSTQTSNELQVLVEPATFSPSITSTNLPVGENSEIVVDYDVTNTGSFAGTKDIELVVDGTTESTTSTELTVGETVSDTFTYTPPEGKTGTIDISVSTPDESNTTNGSIENVPFTLSNTNTNLPVVENTEIVVDYTVVNDGNFTDTKNIEFLFAGTVEETVSKQLSSGETASDSFSYTPPMGDFGDRDITVQTPDESDTQTGTITEGTTSTPSNISITTTENEATISWDEEKYAEEYKVYFSESPIPPDGGNISPDTTTSESKTYSGLTNGEKYYSRVSSIGTIN